jgi:hypothetical protein
MRIRNAVPVLALVAALAQPAASLTIDNFEEGTINDIDASGASDTTQEQSALNTANVVGGVRLVSALATSTGAATATALLNPSAADDSVTMTVVGVPDGNAVFQFMYDGIANGSNDGTGGALNLDLSAFNTLAVTATAVNVTANARVTLWTSTTTQNSAIVPLANGVTAFSLASFGALNLADVQAIRLRIDGLDLLEAPTITAFEAVPEPAAGLMVTLGLVGLGLRRRRAE